MDTSTGNRVKLGDFLIEKKVGEGGMGTVFMARQVSLDRVVALKILPKSFADNPEFVERFRREARAAASLIHPNVVQVYSVGEERGVPYFAMEFVDGQSLDAALKSGRRYEVREALEIAAGVARALEAAFEKGLVHRDIKPANVMLDRKGNVKVTDFGLAKPASGHMDITQPGLVVGTPTYMSPEQGAGEEVGTASDIYSLGVVLYEMLAGEVPFQGDNVGTIIYKHMHETPRPPSALNSGVSRRLDAAVLRCLAKRPDERFRNPGQFLDALTACLRGEDQTDPTIMLQPGARNAGPSGTTVPVPAPVSARRTPVPASAETPSPVAPEPGRVTEPTMRLSAAPRRRGRGVLAFAAALLLAAGAGGYYYWSHVHGGGWPFGPSDPAGPVTPETPADPIAPVTPVTPTTPVDPADPAPGAKLCTLPLSALRGLLPAGSRLELVTPAGTESLDLDNARDRSLPAGSYRLGFSRPGYQSREWQVRLSPEGVTPALDGKSVTAVPTDELAAPYARAEGLLGSAAPGAAEALAALAELQKVQALDPGFRSSRQLRARAGEVLAAHERAWQEKFKAAREQVDARRWQEAADAFRKLQAEVPAGERRFANLYDSIQKQVESAEDRLARTVQHREALRLALRKGDFDAARAAKVQVDLVAAETDELRAMARNLEAAEGAWKAAEAAFAADRFEEAKGQYAAVLQISPDCAAATAKSARCDELLRVGDEVERLVRQAEAQLAGGDPKAGLATLDRLAGKELREHAERAGALRVRAEEGLESGLIAAQLARLAAVFSGRDTGALEQDLLDPRAAAADFRKGLAAQHAALISYGAEVSAWEHRAKEVRLQRSEKGGFRDAQVSAACRFDLRIPSIGRRLSGQVPLKLSFLRLDGRWLLAAAAADGRPEVKSEGRDPAPAGIGGKVAAVDGRIVTVDRGRAHGVAVGMVFVIFEEARVVHLPLTGEKLFVEERPLASAEVIEVAADSSRCALAPDTAPEAAAKIRPGLPAAASRVLTIARELPVVAAAAATPAAAGAGENVEVSLDVKPSPGAFATYRWKADGGVLAAAHTAGPRVTWTAPAKAGEYQVTATVLSPGGSSEDHTVKVRSTGTPEKAPGTYQLEAALAEPDILDDCRDAAFDEGGRAWVLDVRKRRVLLLDPESRLAGFSERFDAVPDISRVAAFAGRLYCLDARNCQVRVYALGANMSFAKEAAKPFGERGEGNARMRSPVDLAVSPSGEVCVLDAPEKAPAVQVFDADGNFLHSLGSPERGTGKLERPVALEADRHGALHVLDAERRRVISFRDGRPFQSFACGGKDAQPVDLAYDAAADLLWVLDAAAGQAAAYSTTGERRGTLTLGAKAGVASLGGATRISAGPAGQILVVSGGGKLLSRFASDGSFLGRIGGEAVSGYCRLAAAPQEGFAALDTSAMTVRCFDRNGWLLSEFGGRQTFRKAVEIDVDAAGQVYVLDAGNYCVKAFDAEGRPQGSYGKRGKPPEGLESPIDVATDGRGALGVLCDLSENSIFRFEIGGAGAPQVFPEERRSTSGPKSLALGADGRTFLLNKKGQVQVWDAGRKSLGTWPLTFRDPTALAAAAGRVFVLDARARTAVVCDGGGGEIARIAMPKNSSAPADIAASDYEAVYVYDSGLKQVLKFRARR